MRESTAIVAVMLRFTSESDAVEEVNAALDRTTGIIDTSKLRDVAIMASVVHWPQEPRPKDAVIVSKSSAPEDK